MERVDARKRVKLFRIALETTPVGETIQCTGFDDDMLCSNLKSRDDSDCFDCGALNLLVTNSNITVSGGIIKKTDTSEELI